MTLITHKIHKGSIKLAGLYLAIIFAISLFFSVTIYQLSIQELDRGLRGPRGGIERAAGLGISQDLRNDIIAEREQLYNEARDRVLERLIIINIIILIGGGFLSYYLALRTLKPIEEAHEAQSRFTADASHELRTPITAICTENEVALLNPKLSLEDAKQLLTSNVEELQKLASLSDGLMRLAGLENATLERKLIDCTALVYSAVERTEQVARVKNISIKTMLPKNTIVVTGDEQGLLESLVILIDNAIKYSPEKTTITVRLTKDVKNVHIRVEDKGIGIKSSDIPHLFDRFYRADTSRTKQNVHGYGLGLAIAKDIITKHDGNITVASKLNSGSIFTISLPVA